jgi:signal transduction histidine kinase
MIKKFYTEKIDDEFNKLSTYFQNLKLPNGFLDFLIYAISELFANIKEHSNAKLVSVKIKFSEKQCFIYISDNGIGLRNSYLSKKIFPKDDRIAIEFALGGYSTKNLQERGFGLYSIRNLMEALKGTMTIRSGKIAAEISKNTITFKEIPKAIKGTAITLDTKIQKIDVYKFIE